MITRLRRDQAGFSLIELMVTIIIAGIVFAAMVPLFVNAASRTAADQSRNVAASAAQARIEMIRALPFNEIAADSTN